MINPIAYAEASARFSSIEDLDDALSKDDFTPSPLPRDAAVSRFALLTRDARRYRTYFPTVELVSPS